MTYSTLLVKEALGGLIITINRLEQQNAINNLFLQELNQVIDTAEMDASCRMIILEGQKGIFCTGMDFEGFNRNLDSSTTSEEALSFGSSKEGISNPYMHTIKRFSLSPKVVISVVDGKVMAGGMGLVAASDLVVATPESQFSLSEALWGLLPAMVTPYLIRRVGYQTAYKLTLTTMPLSGQQAFEKGLVDELSETPYEIVRRFWLKLARLEESTVANMKAYFRKMWIITEQMEEVAVAEITRLTSNPKIIENIRNFVKFQKFPWDNQ